ncbi:rhamnan synthesis F family protein [Niastella vici]|nr:rhamnan synthesis F family protein [Niastella vici]
MGKNTPILSVFFHNYYGNDREWMTYFNQELTLPFYLFYNCVADSWYRIMQKKGGSGEQEPVTGSNLQHLYKKESTNKGKDIGGKLVLMDTYLKMGVQSDYILLLHDKHSPYHTHSNQWKKDLFRIAENSFQQKIIDLFNSDPQTGIVASKNAIRNEVDNEQKRNAYIDSALIQSLKTKYNIQPPGLQYVAGTMFWVKASLFEDFFKQNPPLQIRSELDSGNVTDIDGPTITHAWERLLCWIVTNKGYQIRGI